MIDRDIFAFERDMFFREQLDGGYEFSEDFDDVFGFDNVHIVSEYCFANGYCETIEEYWVYDPLLGDLTEETEWTWQPPEVDIPTIPEPGMVLGFLVLVAVLGRLRKNDNTR